MKSDRHDHASPSSNGLSGANDDSSIVSLKALVAKANSSQPATQLPAVDDSGFIDLKQLMARANATSSSDALPPVLAPNEAGLFDVPEHTPLPQVMQVPSLPEGAAENPSSARGKWIVAGMLVTAVAIGALGGLHVRRSRVAPAQSSVAAPAAVPAVTSEPSKFVEAPRPVETAPVVTHVAPAPIETKAAETKAGRTTTHRSRQAAGNSRARERTRQAPTPALPKAEDKAPAPAPAACDLKCEIERAARRIKAKKQ